MTFKTIAVIGTGQMGAGIAQVCATAGAHVVAIDPDAKQRDRALAGITKSLAKLAEKGIVTDSAGIAARIRFAEKVGDASGADLVIEAIVEELKAKRALWEELDVLCPPDTIFATNTSSLSVGEQAEVTDRPQEFLGLHFFNPVPLMALVEVVRTDRVNPTVVERAVALVRAMGKTPVLALDTPGFVVNRLLVPYLLDAARAAEAKVANTVDIDAGMKLGAGHPMGPLMLLDFVGIDTVVRIADIFHHAFDEERHRAPAILTAMAARGDLGKKSGKGFYDWSGKEPVPMEIK
ncbi:MAG: 3-hydroxyacyl-CoA dehydrogenase family protein [Gemmatimonadota bacterium]